MYTQSQKLMHEPDCPFFFRYLYFPFLLIFVFYFRRVGTANQFTGPYRQKSAAISGYSFSSTLAFTSKIGTLLP
jgi:hypothetical protein